MELAANPALDHHLIRATPRLSPDRYVLRNARFSVRLVREVTKPDYPLGGITPTISASSARIGLADEALDHV